MGRNWAWEVGRLAIVGRGKHLWTCEFTAGFRFDLGTFFVWSWVSWSLLSHARLRSLLSLWANLWKMLGYSVGLMEMGELLWLWICKNVSWGGRGWLNCVKNGNVNHSWSFWDGVDAMGMCGQLFSMNCTVAWNKGLFLCYKTSGSRRTLSFLSHTDTLAWFSALWYKMKRLEVSVGKIWMSMEGSSVGRSGYNGFSGTERVSQLSLKQTQERT